MSKMKGFILSTLNRVGYDIVRAESKQIVQESGQSLDPRIVDMIFDFYGIVEPFYDNMIPEPLKIAGMWRGILERGRKKQILAISQKDKLAYHDLQENMFYNELIDGLWNYDFYRTGSKCPQKFLSECRLFETLTGSMASELVTSKNWKCWGLRTEKGIVKYVDPSHGITAHHILTLAGTIEKFPVILDLGSGYGGLAEKIMSWTNGRASIFLADIPLNLTTAYAYLAAIFGMDRVVLVSSREQLEKTKAEQGRIVLIPTSLIPYLTVPFDIINNTHSFSEMDYSTVKYYLETLVTPNTSYLIETNVGIPDHRFAGHLELMSRDFPIPKTHRLLARFPDGIQSRYVTSIYQSFQGVE